ncbi:hypothetical protein PaeBR_06455 [Paenibacillus sp. BR2-3]
MTETQELWDEDYEAIEIAQTIARRLLRRSEITPNQVIGRT